ncbi:putative gibberellin 2-beta-dioxygenase 8-like [Capsicum annuum]|nr:putative gibberellin 2-beta-dioxygenase 8-like [Capsicum annuum]KAF3661660.1 putative gibberellin 2-beta-dioxygenase 8-like [Capsicum annuum]
MFYWIPTSVQSFYFDQLSDFGLAVAGWNLSKSNVKISGTLGYVALEYLLDGDMDYCDQYMHGCGAHTDYGMITILMTDGVLGLKVCYKELISHVCHYHFSDRSVMEREIKDGKFLEFTSVHGQLRLKSKSKSVSEMLGQNSNKENHQLSDAASGPISPMEARRLHDDSDPNDSR